MPGFVEEELRGYLECGILSFGFARARCTGCGTGFVVAFSCKGRGVCPPAEPGAAAMGTLGVPIGCQPGRTGPWMARPAYGQPRRCPCGSGGFRCRSDCAACSPTAGSAGDTPPAFLPARPINQADLATVTERVRRRLIRWFRRKGLLDAAAAADILEWENSGFSVDASVRIALIDRDVPSYFHSLDICCGIAPVRPSRSSARGAAVTSS